MSKISRREVLKRLGTVAATLSLPPSLWGCAGTQGGRPFLAPPKYADFEKLSPVDRFHGTSKEFSGDNPARLLSQAWANKKQALKGRKPILATDIASVVVVGGGVSGILSAYLLRDLKPILLDKTERFGGNSRGESWENVEYGLGAASLINPGKDSPLYGLYQKAGLASICKVSKGTGPVLLNQKVYPDFWSGQTDRAAAKQFTRLRDFFIQQRPTLPAMPPSTDDDLKKISELDRHDFLAYLVRELGEPLHPHVHTLLELHCWQRLGSSMQDISAAMGMTCYAAEFGERLVGAAGNASVAERFLRLTINEIPAGHARAQCVVLDVRQEKELVHTIYIDQLGVTREQRSQTVVMAAPKFVARKIIGGLETDRQEALSQLEHRSFLVANACLERGPTRDFHRMNLLGQGEIPFGETRRNVHNHGTAGVALANFSQVIRDKSVLTLFYPLPFPGGGEELSIPDAFEQSSAKFKRDLFEKILPPLGYLSTDLQDLRISRWNEAVPVAKPGFYWSGAPKQLSKPFGSRIFFVNQDNWAAPAFETCALEALSWTARVREVVA